MIRRIITSIIYLSIVLVAILYYSIAPPLLILMIIIPLFFDGLKNKIISSSITGIIISIISIFIIDLKGYSKLFTLFILFLNMIYFLIIVLIGHYFIKFFSREDLIKTYLGTRIRKLGFSSIILIILTSILTPNAFYALLITPWLSNIIFPLVFIILPGITIIITVWFLLEVIKKKIDEKVKTKTEIS